MGQQISPLQALVGVGNSIPPHQGSFQLYSGDLYLNDLLLAPPPAFKAGSHLFLATSCCVLLWVGIASHVLAWSVPAVWSRAPAPPPVFTWRFKCVAACGKESSLHIDSLCRVSAFPRPQLLLKSIQQAFTEGGEWLASMPSPLS